MRGGVASGEPGICEGGGEAPRGVGAVTGAMPPGSVPKAACLAAIIRALELNKSLPGLRRFCSDCRPVISDSILARWAGVKALGLVLITCNPGLPGRYT